MTPGTRGAADLGIPPGVRFRTTRVRMGGRDNEATASQIAVRLLLTDRCGAPDAFAVAHVQLAGSQRLAAWAAAQLDVPEAETALAIDTALPALVADARLSVAEAIALRSHQQGIRKAFAYPGTSELALCMAFGALADGVLINSRGDREAVFMAGGANRIVSQPSALAILHGARGLTNAAGAVGSLRRNEVAAVLLVGLPSTSSAQFLPPHGEDGLMNAVGRFAKASFQLVWAETSLPKPTPVAAFDEALKSATAFPAGPVLLGVPQDILEAKVVRPAALTPPHLPASARAVDGKAIRRARQLLANSRSRVILLDDYFLRHEGAREAVTALATRLSAPVFQVRYRRGPMLFEQLTRRALASFAGPYDPGRADHHEIMQQADLLITLEDRNIYPRVVGELPGCRKIAITSNPGKTRRNRYLGCRDAVVSGDPVEAIRALLFEASRQGAQPGISPVGAQRLPGPSAGGTVLQDLLAGVVRICLDHISARYVVDDSQMVGGALAASYLRAFGDDVTVIGDHSGFVGAGIATANGLASATDLPVLCLLGDQGLTNGSQGLVVAAQEGTRVLFLVCNNRESVSLRRQSSSLCAAPIPTDFDRLLRNAPDFSYTAAAWAAGIPAASRELNPEQSAPEQREATLTLVSDLWKEGGPALLELRLPGDGALWDGIWETAGLDEQPGSSCSSAVTGELL